MINVPINEEYIGYYGDTEIDPYSVVAWTFYALYLIGEAVRLIFRRRLYGRFFADDYAFAAQCASVTIFIALSASIKFTPRYAYYGSNPVTGFDYFPSYLIPTTTDAGGPFAVLRANVAFYWISNTATVTAYLMLCRPIIRPFVSLQKWWWAVMIANGAVGLLGMARVFLSLAPAVAHENTLVMLAVVAEALLSIVQFLACYLPFLILWRVQLRKSVRVTSNIFLWIFVGVWTMRAIHLAVGMLTPAASVPLLAWLTTIPSLHPVFNGDGRAWLRGKKRQRYTSVVPDPKCDERHMSVETIQMSDFRRSFDDASFSEDVLQTWESRTSKDNWR